MNFKGIIPIVHQRQCGGYLAVSGLNAQLRIGSTGESEAEAISNFNKELERWQRVYDSVPR